MIFVTIGTHEQPFNRLIEEIDKLKSGGAITEDVFIQKGYSTYKPKFCAYTDFIESDEMANKINAAKIIITHGGPGSIMPILYNNKIPIAAPRQRKYGEHIDDHQIKFCKRLEREGKIIAVYEMDELADKIKNYDELAKEYMGIKKEMNYKEKIQKYTQKLEMLCEELFMN